MNEAQVKIIADSLSPEGIRLTTFQARYWRGIHSELMTHRVFSRNAGSSRARPSQAIIDQVRNDPWGPLHWGSNKPGMQAGEELTGMTLDLAKANWRSAAVYAADMAEQMFRNGLHKQVVNRILEPFTYIDVVLTATDFANWFALRDHPAAQPEIQDLARKMKYEYEESIPNSIHVGEWHLPYITEEDWDKAHWELKQGRITRDEPPYAEKLRLLQKISVARCARVSYKAFDGTVASFGDDLGLYARLIDSQPMHASPAEHQATPDTMSVYSVERLSDTENGIVGETIFEGDQFDHPEQHGNFRGWIQYRKTLPNEYVTG
jgi:hypothetical protein